MSANPTHDAVVAHNDIEKLEKGDNRVSDMHRRTSPTATSFDEKHATEVAHDDAEVAQHQEAKSTFYARYRPFILAATALVILGWWVSATVLKTTRHRWIVQSLFAWSFIFIIAFRFLPTSIISRPIEAVWEPTISRPFFKLPYKTRLGLGWLALLGAVFGSAYGFPLENGSTYVDRTICVVGLLLFQLGFFASSRNRSAIPWPTVIVGLFFQQVIAMFVLKTTAGFDIFTWIATLASDFLNQGQLGVAFFFSQDIADSHWFFASTLGAIMFFIAFIQMLYYLGVMQWLIKNFAWFFFKTMGVSGAEAVVAAASPWVGQGESACLIKPYVDVMTESEIHLVMTSGFSCIAGSVLAVYIGLGAGAQNLVTSSVMSIPASIAISKMRLPEMDTPVTLGRVVVDRGKEDEKNRPANAIHAFSKGAIFGLIIAGQILANVFTILALIGAINGLLTWIGRGFGIHQLTIELVLGYVFYPLTFFMGVPRHEILRVSKLIATKLVANEFVAYTTLKEITASENPLTYRAHTIAAYALCGFANLGSLGIQIGVLTAMAPSRGKIIASIAGSAMICGFLSTMQTAAIAGMLL